MTYSLNEVNKALIACSGWLTGEDSKLERRRIPPLPQKYFVLLWKTMYALFMDSESSNPTEEQQAGVYMYLKYISARGEILQE